MALQNSPLQRASNALAAYLQTALPDVVVYGNWPEPDHKLPPKAITVTSVGPRRVELGGTQMQTIISTAQLSPPDAIQRLYTWAAEAWRQDAQIDIWATSFAACDDIVARLDDALRAGLGATLGQANADPFRDGCLVALDTTTGPPGFADFVFDGEDDDQTPTQSGRDEWRATMRGECAVNYLRVKQQARLATPKLRLKAIENGDPGTTDTFTPKSPRGFTVTEP